MALSIADGTKQKTLDILSTKTGFPVKYARIFARWVTRDNHPGGSFSATLDLFGITDPAPDQTTKLHYEVGCTLPASAIDAMAGTDDRAVLYKHLEYIIQYQDAEERRNVDPDEFDVKKENTALTKLASSLGIETLFNFQEPEAEPVEEIAAQSTE
jgi:hypothetical protein